jgi:uncharacterized membrane protein YfcA
MQRVQPQQVRPSLLRMIAIGLAMLLLGAFMLSTADGGFLRMAAGVVLVAMGIASMVSRSRFELSCDGHRLRSRSLMRPRRIEIPLETARIERVTFGLAGRAEHLLAGDSAKTVMRLPLLIFNRRDQATIRGWILPR